MSWSSCSLLIILTWPYRSLTMTLPYIYCPGILNFIVSFTEASLTGQIGTVLCEVFINVNVLQRLVFLMFSFDVFFGPKDSLSDIACCKFNQYFARFSCSRLASSVRNGYILCLNRRVDFDGRKECQDGCVSVIWCLVLRNTILCICIIVLRICLAVLLGRWVSRLRSPAWWASGFPGNLQQCTPWSVVMHICIIYHYVSLLEINLLLLLVITNSVIYYHNQAPFWDPYLW